jgi:extradiol dioxygenase
MASISQLGYLGLGVSDAAAWERFATGTLGFSVSDRATDGTLKFRMDDYHYRIAVHPGGHDDLSYIGWEVSDRETLAAVAEQIQSAGIEVSRGSNAEAASRNVVELVKFRDPNGVASEVFCGPLQEIQPFNSPRAISGFETGAMGLGHFILVVDDLEKSLEFYNRALGMRISDFMAPESGAFKDTRIVFLHCNPRHHTIAMFANPKTKKRINHIMLELKAVDDVGATYDLCREQKVPIAITLGRHTNDRMMSFYMVNPSGFMIEYGWGGRRVDDATWQIQLHRSGTLWGHHAESVPR